MFQSCSRCSFLRDGYSSSMRILTLKDFPPPRPFPPPTPLLPSSSVIILFACQTSVQLEGGHFSLHFSPAPFSKVLGVEGLVALQYVPVSSGFLAGCEGLLPCLGLFHFPFLQKEEGKRERVSLRAC